MQRTASPLITIVTPVFNEERVVTLFFERLTKALDVVDPAIRFEFLFVNNRSTDKTLEILQKLQETDARIRIITLSRNYGYQASITAGMRHGRGDAIGNIDVDGEDPPEMIPRFIERWKAGVDVVYGLRDKREEFFLMHLGRKLFYRATRRIADHEIVLDMAEFFLVDKRVRDSALASRSTFPFVRGQVGYVGYRREGIPYKREKRIAGETHYNLLGAARFGIAGILSSSTLPLRILAYAGVLFFLMNTFIVGLIGWSMAHMLAEHGPRTHHFLLGMGLIGLIVLEIGWIVLALGALGLYLARVYKDVVALPLYVVDEHLSFESKGSDER